MLHTRGRGACRTLSALSGATARLRSFDVRLMNSFQGAMLSVVKRAADTGPAVPVLMVN
jgi:hypothetical protein